MDTKASLGCFTLLAVAAVATGGLAVLGPILGLFMVKFVIPAVVLGLLALAFFRLILADTGDDPTKRG